jgi:polyvinyl alcohol dehydrogenase (cytochrome)
MKHSFAHDSRLSASHGAVACIALLLACSTASAAEQSAEDVYKQRCASCHDNSTDRAPTRAAMGSMSTMYIAASLLNGKMQSQATGLSADQVTALATLLGARSPQTAAIAPPPACDKAASALTLRNPGWNGWSPDVENTRFQPTPGVTATDVPRLKLKWTYGYSGPMAYGQPIYADGRVIVTNANGDVVALNADKGCMLWQHQAGAGVKSAVSIAALGKGATARHAVLFGDEKAIAHAVDADTGKQLWTVKLDDHPFARVTGAPKYYDGRLFVPISSIEEVPGRAPNYECCKFRGSVVALDVLTGKILWKAHSIAEEPKPFKKSSAGTQMYGPAGGAIWSSPTIDVKRKLVYAASGNSYTNVDSDGSDAVLAFDLDTGARKWASQVTPKDNFLVGCNKTNAGQNNCPEDAGPDFDFGSSPILRTLPNGKQIILAGQKSGVAYGLDPDANGKVLWQQRVGQGSPLGGIEWGMAADGEHLYVGISDMLAGPGGMPGLSALSIATGEKVWHTPTPTVECSFGKNRCTRAQPSAVSAIPGVVFSGAIDGHIRAYSAKDGAIVWDFDTAHDFKTVNGVDVKGGSIDAGGTVIADGKVFVNSGYGAWGSVGRLMMVFTVDGK